MKRCKICYVQAELIDGRCRSCIIAKDATDNDMTYGKYMAKYNGKPPIVVQADIEAPKPKPQKRESKTLPKVKICPQCGREFTTSRRTYCSTDCQQEHKSQCDKERGKRATAIRRGNADVRYCRICGEQIPMTRNLRSVTCSEKCANDLKSKRRMERYYELIGIKH